MSSPMEAEPRRWAATYTKHLKQKRKAYHDGALLLYPDSGRLVLLDDGGDTLESRFLRASEEVSAGAALSFHSYLVDIGEPEACPAGSRSSSSAAAASRTAHRGGSRPRPPSAAGSLNSRAPRAFVNLPKSRWAAGSGEGEATGSGDTEEAASKFQEWTALYTAQLTQKAKKYHDGVVRLEQAGPVVKQIVLLDEDGQVLGSRHLRSGESIETGKKCVFPNYLIEICEAKNEKEGIHALEGPMVHTSAKSGGDTCNKMGLSAVSKSQKFISPQNFHDLEGTKSEVIASSNKPETGRAEVASAGSFTGTDPSFKEWNALYTTQLTQKAKKYHDGVIRLLQVGSHARQIVLLDEDGGVLGSRYLNSVESIESGAKCQIPNYLIEVSELRNQKNECIHSLEEANQTGQKVEENVSDKTGAKSKSPKFVSPFKFQDARKSNCESTTSSNRPLVGKTAFNNMNSRALSDIHSGKSDSDVNGRADHCSDITFTDIQRGRSKNNIWPEVGKSWPSNVGDPLKFHDLQDGKSRCPTNFIRKEVDKSSFGNMDDSIRTASQILSIMKPPSEIRPSQSAPSEPAHSLVSSNSRKPFDASHTNNSTVDDSNGTFDDRGHSGLSRFATQLRTSVQSCLSLNASHINNSMVDDSNGTFDDRGHSGLSRFATQLRTSVQSCLSLNASHTNNSVVDASNRTFDGSGHSGLAHFATQLRTSVQSCLSLETPQQNSVMAHQWNESSGTSHPTQDIMRPAAFESQDSAMVDILASDTSNTKEQKPDSSNHYMGSSNDTVPSDPGLQDDKSKDWKCYGSLSTSAYTLTCKDPKIQELIDDCPSFDLGF